MKRGHTVTNSAVGRHFSDVTQPVERFRPAHTAPQSQETQQKLCL